MEESTKAMLIYLYRGGIISQVNIYPLFGFTNCSRELIRQIEIPFGITLNRNKIKVKSRWGKTTYPYEYSLKKEDKQKVIELLKKIVK